ncbi:glycoside hydrolase [Sphingomonas sp. 4RDLI-65]|uniref:glycoside hydrolase n=1 Tax=Sphingomonas sp. 4RDLI-65 TaxID=3111641 RepID=UPI003C220217
MIRAATAAALLLSAGGALAQTHAPAAPAAVTVALHPAIDRPSTVFEGWGTALAWFANVTGGWPDAERQRLADLFYGPDGLGWTIARYNIGGGNSAETPPYLRQGAAVPGFWRRPSGATCKDWWRADDEAVWDWSQDTNQRWWLDAISARVKHPIFEAFSNSPPWFMTVSGRVSGAEARTDENLRPGQEGAFAAYLARSVDELQRRHRIGFRTLSPVNEPNTDYWYAANTQEGAHWSPARQAAMIDATHAALQTRGLKTTVAAPDETNALLFAADWAGYPPATRARIGQLNVHSYGTTHQTAVRDIARAAGIRLWMSEDDTPLEKDAEDFTGMATPLAFAEHVVMDLKRLEPSAWVFWQAVEHLSTLKGGKGSNWGLVKADLLAGPTGTHPIHVTRKYYAMAQFSRFIRPGYRLVPIDDLDTAGALSADRRTLVLVHVNAGITPRRLVLPRGWTARMLVTDATRNVACASGTTAPPRAIVTLILTRRPGGEPCPGTAPPR